MKNVKASRAVGGLKYKLFDSLKQSKKSIFIIIVVSLIGLFTGIFTAIRYSQGACLLNFNDFSLCEYLSGDLGTYELFFSRLFSCSIVTVIVWVCSFSIFLAPVNCILMTYRSYLLGLNASLIIILHGLGGIVTCFLIIIPCQIISLFILAVFCSYSCKKACLRKKYGSNECKIWDKFLITLLLLTIMNLIETFLLYIFSSKVILVI